MPVKKIFLVPEEDWTEIKKHSNIEDINHVIIPSGKNKKDKMQDTPEINKNDNSEKGEGKGKEDAPPPPSLSSVGEKKELQNSTKSSEQEKKEITNDKNVPTAGTWRPPGKLVSGMEVRLKNPWKKTKKKKSKEQKKSKFEWISI